MKVNKSLEGPEGTVTFEGNLSAEEVDILLGIGLNFLMQKGALPFMTGDPKVLASLAPVSQEIQ